VRCWSALIPVSMVAFGAMHPLPVSVTVVWLTRTVACQRGCVGGAISPCLWKVWVRDLEGILP